MARYSPVIMAAQFEFHAENRRVWETLQMKEPIYWLSAGV